MQSGHSVSSTANVGMDANVIHLQPANNAQQNTRFVTSNIVNQTQLMNVPRAPGQYITIPPGGFQILPVQRNNAAQYIQLQLQNVQQGSAGNFVRIQTTPNQNLQKNLTQAFVQLQPQIASNQTNQQNHLNQNVSIQLLQNPVTGTIQNNNVDFLQQKPMSTLQSPIRPSIGTIAQSTGPNIQIGNINRNLTNQIHNTIAGGQKLMTVTTSSSLFQALKQAGATTSLAEASTNNTMSPIPDLRPLTGSSSIVNPSAITSQIKTNEQKAFQGTIVVMSGGNKQSIIIPKTQAGNIQQMNPVFLPITMANNVSVLTNQGVSTSLAPKRIPQSSVLKIQQQIAPRQTQANNAQAPIATSATGAVTALLSQNSQQKYYIQPSMLQPQGTQLQIQPQQQSRQFIFQTVQQNITHLNAQRKNDVFVSTASTSKTQNHASISSSSAPDSKPLKKPCNCTKSQCLKLYCECFANGEFCNNCNCRMCLNNINHEAERSKAIKACLERNAYAFHPKIGKGKVKGDNERRHTKGCNCKRSGCLKNYCECYEAKILCSSLCRCSGCKNFEESDDRKTLMHLADAAEVCVQQQNAAKSKLATHMDIVPKKVSNGIKEKLPVSFLTADVSKATCEILMAKATEGENEGQSTLELEKSVILEFSRCLDQIIDKSHKAKKGKR